MVLLEKEKGDLQEALAASRAEAMRTAEELENAQKETRAAMEAKAKAEEAQNRAEDRCTCRKEIIQ